MQLSELVQKLNDLAPLYLAEDWDNVGLLVGRSEREVSAVMLTIDVTPDVVKEAIRAGVQVLIAYHPVIFHPLQRLCDDTPREKMLIDLLEAGISVYSPHTALDAVQGGVTDWLCDGLAPAGDSGSGGDRRALIPFESLPPTEQCKLVTFVPHNEVERVRSALATTGAGLIGNYEQCSFSVAGTGSFRGLEGAEPAIGEAGRLEHVREVRLEMVLSRASVPLALETLQRFHPYEEPAVDIYDLRPRPERNRGTGRKIVLDQPVPFAEIVERMHQHLHQRFVKFRDMTGGKPLRTIGVVPGAGASLLPAAVEQGCELFVTGEMKHHEVLNAALQGCSVLLAGHTNTERGYLPTYARQISEKCPDIKVHISKEDRTSLSLE